MKIISRADARQNGYLKYFTGNPCKHGHISQRTTINGSCCECSSIRQKNSYYADREANLAKQKLRRSLDTGRAERKRIARRLADPELQKRVDSRKHDLLARNNANKLGIKTYPSLIPCSHNHTSDRFSSDGKCVECNKIRCKNRYDKYALSNPSILEYRSLEEYRKNKAEEKKRIANAHAIIVASRQNAISNNLLTYIGKQCHYGHNGERYTSSGFCVECAKQKSQSQEKKEYDAIYYHKNIDVIKAKTSIYHAKNPLKSRLQAKQWAADNKDKVKVIKSSYTARRRAKTDAGDTTQAIYLWEKSQKKVCYWCNKHCIDNYHIDHYEPLSKGGTHTVDNLVISCPTCNLTKNAKDPYKYANTLGKLF